jgi:hypothetical protein
MTRNIKHTELPWHVSATRPEYILCKKDTVVADVLSGKDWEIIFGNAELIVKCVNNYERLVAMVKELREVTSTTDIGDKTNQRATALLVELEVE